MSDHIHITREDGKVTEVHREQTLFKAERWEEPLEIEVGLPNGGIESFLCDEITVTRQVYPPEVPVLPIPPEGGEIELTVTWSDTEAVKELLEGLTDGETVDE